MPSWWNGPTETGFGLVCEFDTECGQEAMVLAWIWDRERRAWVAAALCLKHLATVCQVPLAGAA